MTTFCRESCCMTSCCTSGVAVAVSATKGTPGYLQGGVRLMLSLTLISFLTSVPEVGAVETGANKGFKRLAATLTCA